MKNILITLTTVFAFTVVAHTQDIDQNQVPSVILNNFKKQFPKAYDIEWEKKLNTYEVEFENEKSKDHEIVYNFSGEIIKQKIEISAKELNKAIRNTLRNEFSDCIISEVEMIEEKGQKKYKIELKSIFKEWDVVVNENGEILSRKED